MLTRLLERKDIEQYSTVRLVNYPHFNHDPFDVLVYQTFPDENHKGKFNKSLIEQADAKLGTFKGKVLLLDSFDNANGNGYTRFPSKIPRIKVCGGSKYQQGHNCVFVLPAFNLEDWYKPELNTYKNFLTLYSNTSYVPVHCAFKTDANYPHTIRKEIIEKLKTSFLFQTAFCRVPLPDYLYFLNHVKISVVAPGFGQTSHSAYHTLQAGACLFHHKSLLEIELFNGPILEDGIDFVSFDMNNFEEKLRFLLDNPEETAKIGRNGQKQFVHGINLNLNCDYFIRVLKNDL
jgi:hypothetical protein